ncbi:MAG: PEP-CTERM sorting domain-containing protein [Fimbriimonadales bacterium]|nr:PEP-CTERM sorting domain-containing protein [Fimbriimonadales bacterium]
MKFRNLAAIAACAVSAGAYAGPIVLFDNLKHSGYQSSGWTISAASAVAQMFVAPKSATLTQLFLALSAEGSPTYDVFLMDSQPGDVGVNGIPDIPGNNQLASWINVAGAGLNSLSFVVTVNVTAGSKYWVLVASNSGSGQWLFNNNGILGTNAMAFGNNTFWLGDDENLGGGLKVLGETGVPVPEPATLALAGLGLAAALRRRKRA